MNNADTTEAEEWDIETNKNLLASIGDSFKCKTMANPISVVEYKNT